MTVVDAEQLGDDENGERRREGLDQVGLTVRIDVAEQLTGDLATRSSRTSIERGVNQRDATLRQAA